MFKDFYRMANDLHQAVKPLRTGVALNRLSRAIEGLAQGLKRLSVSQQEAGERIALLVKAMQAKD